jgi:hypothetical protein
VLGWLHNQAWLPQPLADGRVPLTLVTRPLRVLLLDPGPLARPVRLVESLGDDALELVLADRQPERGAIIEARA